MSNNQRQLRSTKITQRLKKSGYDPIKEDANLSKQRKLSKSGDVKPPLVTRKSQRVKTDSVKKKENKVWQNCVIIDRLLDTDKTESTKSVKEKNVKKRTQVTTKNKPSQKQSPVVKSKRNEVDEQNKLLTAMEEDVKRGFQDKKSSQIKSPVAKSKSKRIRPTNKENVGTRSQTALASKNKENLEENQMQSLASKHGSPQSGLTKTRKVAAQKTAPEASETKKQRIIYKKEKPVEASLVSRFRNRKHVVYAESILEVTKKENNTHNNIKRVPIYQQQMKDDITHKRKGDQYEFDSDSEKYKKRKKKKLDSSSDEYNLSIEKIPKKIRNKANQRKPRRKPIVRDDQNKNVKKKIVKDMLPKVESNNNLTQIKPVVKLDGKLMTDGKIGKTVSIESMDENLENENNDVEDCFGFEDAVTKPKINIISNVKVHPNKELNISIATPTLFKEGNPNANSTMLNNILTPWRFNEMNIRRNPHFIALKQSSLPSVNQDMVLDHTIVDKFEEVEKAKEKSINRPAVQKTLTDYFTSNVENKENLQVSLFDNDLLSPIKTKSRCNNIGGVKRKILGERDDNIMPTQGTSTPVQNRQESYQCEAKIPDKTDTYFGFDSLDWEDQKENSPTRDKDNKPFRMSIKACDKKYERKRKFPKRLTENFISSEDEESDGSESDLESRGGEVKLFEDFPDTQELLEIQDEKMMKKNKLKACKDGKKHKRRKDVRSKEEEEEAEKWASAFNSMCEEVEEFPLEIE